MKLLRKAIFAVFAVSMLAANAEVGDIPRSTPAAEGVEAKAVITFLDSLQHVSDTYIHHVMVLRHGKVITEMHPSPFNAEESHTLFSESKTFTAMAVGLCVDDGLLRVTDRVINFFPGKLPETVSDNLSNLTIKDLLTMKAGVKPVVEPMSQFDDWEKLWLSLTVDYEPGTRWQYDSMATYMLSAIVQRVTGKTVLQLMQERLFTHMDITDAQWELSPTGICTGGWGLRLQAESQAKMGLLLLQKGKWNGRQLISEEWIDEASSSHAVPYKTNTTANVKSPGYGYQIWMNEYAGSYRADGAFGQFIVVIPDKDMVVVINGESRQTGGELKCIWRQLIPGVKDAPLVANADQKQLEKFVAKAEIPTTKGKATPNKYVGKKLSCEANGKRFEISFVDADNLTYTCDNRTVASAYKTWKTETSAQRPPYFLQSLKNSFSGLEQSFTAASSFAWNGKELTIHSHWTNFGQGEMVKVKFLSGDKVQLTIHNNWESKPRFTQTVNSTLK